MSFLRPALLVATVLLAACDYPTSLPTWDTRWEIPADSTALRVDSVLPARVRVNAERSAFLLDVDPIVFGSSLGEACSACAAAHGATVPKPAFTLGGTGDSPLPTDVAQAALAGGQVTLRVANGFSFDPLRPSADATAPRGTMTLLVRAGGSDVASVAVRGDETAFAPGTTLERVVSLGSATIDGAVEVTLSIQSPAGDPVRVDTAQRVTVTAIVDEARVASASVRVPARAIAFDSATLDLGDVDGELVDRVVDGALVLAIENPFALTGDFTARITAPGIAIARALAVPPGASTATLALSGDELRALLGTSPVTLAVRGTLAGPSGGFVTVTPAQALRVASRLRLTLRSEAR